MSPHQQDRWDRNLVATLKAGDPAAENREPGEQEIAAWRQRMLTTAHRSATPRRRRRFLVPAAASLITAALAMALLIHLLKPTAGETNTTGPEINRVTQAQADQQILPPASADTPSPVDLGAGTGPGSRVAEAETATDQAQAEDIGTQPAPTRRPSPAPPAPMAAAARRTIQFTAPGGTRVIWTLNSQLNIPASGGAL